jgi:hypothetical protein
MDLWARLHPEPFQDLPKRGYDFLPRYEPTMKYDFLPIAGSGYLPPLSLAYISRAVWMVLMSDKGNNHQNSDDYFIE